MMNDPDQLLTKLYKTNESDESSKEKFNDLNNRFGDANIEVSETPELIKRDWVLNQNVERREDQEVTIMHWNILADRLAHETFPKVPKKYLRWSYRFKLIMQHIRNTDADIIGLSEVDVLPLYRDIADAMNKLGYADYFKEK